MAAMAELDSHGGKARQEYSSNSSSSDSDSSINYDNSDTHSSLSDQDSGYDTGPWRRNGQGDGGVGTKL